MVTITRDFDAPVALVFRAYTEADLFRQWIGPRNRTFELQAVRLPHRRRLALQHRATRTSRPSFYGAFHEVRPDERIVQTFTFEGSRTRSPWRPRPSRTSAADGAGSPRCRWWDSFEARDAFVASGMETGVVEGFEKLDELLETLPDRRLDPRARGWAGSRG